MDNFVHIGGLCNYIGSSLALGYSTFKKKASKSKNFVAPICYIWGLFNK